MLDQTSQNEWVVDPGYTHHMDKDPSLFSSLDFALEKKIFLVNNFAHDIVRYGIVICRHGCIFNVFHVPSLNENIFSVSQLIRTKNIIEFWPDQLFIKNLKDRSIIIDGTVDPKDQLYKLRNLPQLEFGKTILIAEANEQRKIGNEQLGHLNFHNLNLIMT